MTLMDQPNAKPTRKWRFGAFWGTLAALAVAMLSTPEVTGLAPASWQPFVPLAVTLVGFYQAKEETVTI